MFERFVTFARGERASRTKNSASSSGFPPQDGALRGGRPRTVCQVSNSAPRRSARAASSSVSGSAPVRRKVSVMLVSAAAT